MKRNSIYKTIIQVIDFFAMIIILNIMESKKQIASNLILNDDFIDEYKNQQQFLLSMDVLILLQKSFVMIICSCILYCAKYISKQKTANNDGGNTQIETEKLQLSLTRNKEIFLGSVTFLALKVFIESQFSVNVIFMVISKYINTVLIFCLINHVAQKKVQENTKKQNNKQNSKIFNISIMILLVTGVSLVKLIFTDMFVFYRGNGGKSFFQRIELKDFLIVIVSLLLDCALYVRLYFVKSQLSTNKSLKQEKHQSRLQRNSVFQPVVLLRSWTKYSVMLFFVYTLMNGEFSQFLNLVNRHPDMLVHIIELSMYYFVSQWIICRVFLKYSPIIFFSILITTGMFGKTYFYIFKSFSIRSVPYYMVLFALFFMLKKHIQQQNQSIWLIQVKDKGQKCATSSDLENIEGNNEQQTTLQGTQIYESQ